MTRESVLKTLAYLREEPRTAVQLEELTGFTHDTVRRHIQSAQKLVFIEPLGLSPRAKGTPGHKPILWGWKGRQ